MLGHMDLLLLYHFHTHMTGKKRHIAVEKLIKPTLLAIASFRSYLLFGNTWLIATSWSKQG